MEREAQARPCERQRQRQSIETARQWRPHVPGQLNTAVDDKDAIHRHVLDTIQVNEVSFLIDKVHTAYTQLTDKTCQTK